MVENLKIGFEIHAQMATRQKLYCDCPTDYAIARPNENTCAVCTGLPGNKPMPVNEEAVYNAIELALLFNSNILKGSEIRVQRKHYEYPDLPNGYQKTSTPVARGGEFMGVRIDELHLEDDPGRYDLAKGKVDYNRCGIPLVEIVTHPDMKSPEQARKLWDELSDLIQYTGRFRTETGAMRADTNVSIRNVERVEVKNVNSSSGVYYAILYEIKRQEKAWRRKQPIKRETRGFVDDKMITVSLRTKETFADYRYIPDPDIPPIVINDGMIDAVRARMKPNPFEVTCRYVGLGLTEETAKAIAFDTTLTGFFEQASTEAPPREVAKWLAGDVRKHLKQKGVVIAETKLTPDALAKIINSVREKEIPAYEGKDVLRRVIYEGGDVTSYLGKVVVTQDKGALNRLVIQVIQDNPDTVRDIKAGNEGAINYLMGQVRKKSKAADPSTVLDILREKLNK